MKRILFVLIALVSVGCVMDPEPKTRVISCGTLDLQPDGWEDEVRDTATVKDGTCSM
jgi:hypothetical protein